MVKLGLPAHWRKGVFSSKVEFIALFTVLTGGKNSMK
jgi:hypothetical protein